MEEYERKSTGSDEDIDKPKEIELNELNNVSVSTNERSFHYGEVNSTNNSNSNLELKADEFKEIKSYKFGNTYQFFFIDGIPLIVLGPHCKIFFIKRVSFCNHLFNIYYNWRRFHVLLLEFLRNNN